MPQEPSELDLSTIPEILVPTNCPALMPVRIYPRYQGCQMAGKQSGGGGGSAPYTQHSGGFNLQDYPNLWNQLQQGHEGPAIHNQGNCIANRYGWTGSE